MGDFPAEFYDIPIETLGLSAETLNVFKGTDITSVGDCVEYLVRHRLGHFMGVPGSPSWSKAMFDEVKPKLKERGYLRQVKILGD